MFTSFRPSLGSGFSFPYYQSSNRTVDIVVHRGPDSTVSRPYFVMREDGYENYRLHDSFDEAMLAAFPESEHNGHNLLYLTDGDILCRECAVKHYIETGEALNYSPIGDNYGMGETCGECNAVIIPECCVNCGEEDLDDRIMFVKESGDIQVCGKCLAEVVVSGCAHKTGKGEYTVRYDRQHMKCHPWWGAGVYVAYWVHR